MNRFISLEKVSPLSIYTHILYMHSRKQHTLYLHRLKVTSDCLSVKLLQSQADRKRQGFEETGFKVFSSSRISYKKREAFVLLVTKWHESHTHTHTHYVTMCVLDATILFSPLAEAKSLPDVPTAHNGTFFCRIKPSETLSSLSDQTPTLLSHSHFLSFLMAQELLTTHTTLNLAWHVRVTSTHVSLRLCRLIVFMFGGNDRLHCLLLSSSCLLKQAQLEASGGSFTWVNSQTQHISL